jgi:tetratricopeptide (TPR) repeat protein
LEGGLLGLVLFGGVCWIAIRGFMQTWRAAPAAERRSLAAYVGVAVAVVAHHTLDFLFESPLYALGVLGLLMVVSPASAKSAAVGARRVAAALLGSLVTLGVLLAGLSRGSTEYWDGLQQASQGDWDEAASKICGAADVNPAWTLYSFQCALAEVNSPAGDPEAARRRLTETLATDPYWPVHIANLGALEWSAGQRDPGLENMQRAALADPQNTAFALNVGWMEEQLGHEEPARDAYEEALKADPLLRRRLFFASTPLRQEVVQSYELPDLSPEWYRAFYGGWLALDRQAWEEASALMREALSQDPRLGPAYAGLAVAADAMGDQGTSARAMGTALFLESGSPDVLYAASILATRSGGLEDGRFLLEAAYRQARESSASKLYYGRAYSRFFLPGDLVPQVRTATLTPAMAADLEALADYYIQHGRPTEAGSLRQFLVTESGSW